MAQARFKFRLWNKEQKEYFNGDIYLRNKGGVYREFQDAWLGDIVFGKDFNHKYVIEQCTGVKDKHGKLIYEGDVLLLDDGFVKTKIRVKWVNDSQMFEMPFLSEKESNGRRYKCVEIVGNVHQKGESK